MLVLKQPPGEGCEESAGQTVWCVLSKCSISADYALVPAGSPSLNTLPCPSPPLCRNYRDITACRLLPSPSWREKRKQKAKQSLAPSSKPLPGSAEVLLMRAGQAYRNPTSSSKGSYQTSTSRFNVAFHVPLDKPKDKEPLFRSLLWSTFAAMLESLSSFGSSPTPFFLLT